MRPTIDYDVATFYTRMSNIGFRLLLVPGADGLTSLGHTPADAVHVSCDWTEGRQHVRVRRLRHRSRPICSARSAPAITRRSQAAYLRIGQVGAMFVPAEIGAESTIGLPAGYIETPANWHADDLSLHASGADYVDGRLRQEPHAGQIPVDRRPRQRRDGLRRPAGRLPGQVRGRRPGRTRHVRRPFTPQGPSSSRMPSPGRRARPSPRTHRYWRPTVRPPRRSPPAAGTARHSAKPTTTTRRRTPSAGTSKPTSSPRWAC